MKKFAVGYMQRGILMTGEILAECEDHAIEICRANNWDYEGEIEDTFAITDEEIAMIDGRNEVFH